MKKIVLIKKAKVILLLGLIFGLFNISALAQEKRTSAADEKREAVKAWEALIKMKGGREKLHSISNMLLEFPKKTQPEISQDTRLFVFPNRYWRCAYHFYQDKSYASRFDGNIQQYATENGITDIKHSNLSDWFVAEWTPFLLETKWDKPELLGVKRIKIGKKKFEVIEAKAGMKKIDFIYEPEEMLVLEVHFYDDEGIAWQKYKFADYTDVGGIKMPQKFQVGIDISKFEELKTLIPIKFGFNVEYDPILFDRPLKATTPDAWKSKE